MENCSPLNRSCTPFKGFYQNYGSLPNQKPLINLVFFRNIKGFCRYDGIYTGKIFPVQEAGKQVLEHFFRQKCQVVSRHGLSDFYFLGLFGFFYGNIALNRSFDGGKTKWLKSRG